MCGIAGIQTINGSAPDPALLDAMRAALAHRGPDGDGTYVSGDTGLIQTRLAIIDLETGQQPLHGPQGTALVGNGEIYNYIELRQQMAGTSFATHSDFEPPLHLYARDGLNFSGAMRGMYAQAIHDQREGRLVISRDPFGIKPLYFAETSKGFIFASQPSALIATGLVKAELNPAARDELVQLQFTCGTETIFKGIRRILPGETVTLRHGRIIDRSRRAALPPGAPEEIDEEAALARLDAALIDSVMVHQRSDVPYGMFLSGGIDSAAVLALMAKLSARPVMAYTIGFSGTSARDERDHARLLAGKVGAQHHEVDFTEADFWSLLPQVAADLDDPVADYAVLPTWKLAREARRDVKVVLSGEGGDEIFAGYGRYRSVMRPWWLGGRAMRPKGILDRMNVLRRESLGWRDGILAAESLEDGGGRTRLQVAQAVDIADWLPNDLLTKLDRCLMAHGMEGRTPLLDPVVAAAAFCLPDRLKVRKSGGKLLGKYVLRRWLEANLPEAQPFSPKRGFTVPVGEWIAAQGARLGPLVARQPGIAEFCHPDAVEKVFRTPGKRTGFAAWTLLFYALWHRRHILGAMPSGGVFDLLGERA